MGRVGERNQKKKDETRGGEGVYNGARKQSGVDFWRRSVSVAWCRTKAMQSRVDWRWMANAVGDCGSNLEIKRVPVLVLFFPFSVYVCVFRRNVAVGARCERLL